MRANKFRNGFIELSNEREKEAVRIIADGAIAHVGVGEGRLIPVAILDTTKRPDLEEFIRVHQHLGPGDVKCQWGQLFSHENTVALILSFSRPIKLAAIIEFDLEKHQGALVEQILGTRALYLQAGREGDRLKDDVNLPKVIVEVPDAGFRKGHWDGLFTQYTITQMRKRGLNRSAAKDAAKMAILELRKLGTIRMEGSR